MRRLPSFLTNHKENSLLCLIYNLHTSHSVQKEGFLWKIRGHTAFEAFGIAICAQFQAAFQTSISSVAHETLVHTMVEWQTRKALVACGLIFFGQEFSLGRSRFNDVWSLYDFDGLMYLMVSLKAEDLSIWSHTDTLLGGSHQVHEEYRIKLTVLLKICIF